ncbi:hypothetical protein C5708_13610 [Caulobacter sp. CCUG 60055]|uniref:hypothetical protein n=1 Tax=Caulobacter sp. CCUG 60055 TaxID=2100090 RepID=UPI001FA6BCE6|nr:hypothetical protein [Caulobacter sp. CCUG 60055]MCI3181289.1 hypothetical protein [Caulobacter sp. CCUG 60055]
MAASIRRVRGESLAYAVAGAILIHAALIAWMAAHLDTPSGPREPQAISVTLTPPWPAGRSRRPAHSPPARKAEVPVAAPPSALTPNAEPAGPAPPAMAKPEQDERLALQRALRDALACRNAMPDASREARQACQDRFAAGRRADGPPPRLNLDRRGDFAASQDPEAYLPKKPKNGCKARAAGTVTVLGQEGAAAGVGCAWSF